jgi:hypothetical protein
MCVVPAQYVISKTVYCLHVIRGIFVICFKNCFVSVAYVQVNWGPFLVVYCMKWVLLKFSERLLALNHLFKCSNTVIMSLIKSVGLELVTYTSIICKQDWFRFIPNKVW